MTPLSQPDSTVRNLVAAADRQRRARTAFSRIQWLAPRVAAAALVVAAGARWLGASAWISWAAFATVAAILLSLWIVMRRERDTTDAIASAIDTDASLAGELRSAHWFESQSSRDAWAE